MPKQHANIGRGFQTSTTVKDSVMNNLSRTFIKSIKEHPLASLGKTALLMIAFILLRNAITSKNFVDIGNNFIFGLMFLSIFLTTLQVKYFMRRKRAMKGPLCINLIILIGGGYLHAVLSHRATTLLSEFMHFMGSGMCFSFAVIAVLWDHFITNKVPQD
jgi:hypothetical protein